MAIPASQNSSTDGHSIAPALAAVDLVAITTHDDFLLELGQALGGQASVTPVESASQALERLSDMKKRLSVVAIDARATSELSADIEKLNAQAAHVAILVFAEASEESTVAGELENFDIFAVLTLPVDVQRTFALFEGAVTESKARQSLANGAPAAKATIVFEASAPAAPEAIRPEPREPTKSPFNIRTIGGVTLAVAAAAALWLSTRGGEPDLERRAVSNASTDRTGPTSDSGPAIETSVVKGKVDELLEKARLSMRERHYTEPAGDNALLYYRSAAYADPSNGEALDGLNRIAAVLASRFEEAMAAGQTETAVLALAQLKSAVPSDARVQEFQSRLAKLRADIQRAEQEEARQKRLAEQQAAREAAAAEQKKARDARAAAAAAETERQAQLASERELQEKLRQQQTAKVDEASKAQSKPAVSRRSTASLQNSLKRKRYVEPAYPADQLFRGIGGVVTVAFTVNVKGEPTDVRVESADPATVFDRAAVDAVKRWRYEPMVIDGVPTEVPVRLAIRFASPE